MSNWSENLNFDRIPLSSGDSLPSLALIDLSNWALVTLIGDDKKSYLHGQVTCDVVGLAADQSTLAGHCDAKGKLRTVFRLFHHNDGYGFLQRRSVMATQLPELKKYAIFSKVDIEASSDVLLGIAGSEADAQIAQLFGGEGDVRAVNGGTAVKIDSQRWLLALHADAAGDIANKLAATAVLSDDSLWDLYDIRAAFPRVDAATELEFIPQAVNLQALGGISFTKGCYTGQETVARAKYRGINKRAMYIVSGPAEHGPQAGDSLERSVGENWRKGGTIVAGYQFTDGQATALVVLPNDLDEGTTFRLAEGEDVWHLQALPYSLDDNG
ncbi:tRNA-modifying protein YgfZ [Photobacterium sp. DA100]|uniref:tRNA-modifying protein YgfZ n=1 Tax=Photobacterium sp. DA100 TaxID=3027472 RepID=UPI00247A5FF1|nr:tRNA-modifying protein YgfZ [Photobacterium sp. DA100]WEM42741.1 tRNA-modifying protein YgfZ [Photobacterium sp. DA100]